METGSKLIFIVSQPRAGSTLLQSVLSNNSEINTVSEPWILLALAPLLRNNIATTKYDYNLTLNAVSEFEKKYPDFNLHKSAKTISDSFYQKIFENKYKFIIDKTPRYYEIVDLIQNLYPNAKIIILKRNPIDVLLSLIKKRHIVKSKDLIWNNRDILLAPMIMQTFLDNNSDNENIIELRYEDMVHFPKDFFKNIYNKVDIKFFDEVLDIKNNKKTEGKFGDKNINSNHEYSQINSKTEKPSLSKEMKKFIQGYMYYLTPEFLIKYGSYNMEELSGKKTRVFDKFLKMAAKENNAISKSIYNKFARN